VDWELFKDGSTDPFLESENAWIWIEDGKVYYDLERPGWESMYMQIKASDGISEAFTNFQMDVKPVNLACTISVPSTTVQVQVGSTYTLALSMGTVSDLNPNDTHVRSIIFSLDNTWQTDEGGLKFSPTSNANHVGMYYPVLKAADNNSV